jgi:hypothetical protein
LTTSRKSPNKSLTSPLPRRHIEISPSILDPE